MHQKEPVSRSLACPLPATALSVNGRLASALFASLPQDLPSPLQILHFQLPLCGRGSLVRGGDHRSKPIGWSANGSAQHAQGIIFRIRNANRESSASSSSQLENQLDLPDFPSQRSHHQTTPYKLPEEFVRLECGHGHPIIRSDTPLSKGG